MSPITLSAFTTRSDRTHKRTMSFNAASIGVSGATVMAILCVKSVIACSAGSFGFNSCGYSAGWRVGNKPTARILGCSEKSLFIGIGASVLPRRTQDLVSVALLDDA